MPLIRQPQVDIDLASLSGALSNEITAVSGHLQTQITDLVQPSSCLLISGSQYNGVYALTVCTDITLTKPTLNVNGLVYNEDVGTSGGFNLMYSGGFQYLIWNYTNYMGFSLVDSDNIVLNYWV